MLQEALRACGVGDDDEVVVYDQATSLASGRAWWVLRWAGHPQVRVLDGGLAAWRRAGMPVTDEVPTPPPGDLTVRPGSVPVLDAGGAVDMARHGVLLDARAPERFRGEVEPIDRVAGHVPGSVNLPMTDLLTPDGCFLPAAEVRRRAAAVGVHRDTPVGTSCGSGRHGGPARPGAAHRRHRRHPLHRVVERVDRGPPGPSRPGSQSV